MIRGDGSFELSAVSRLVDGKQGGQEDNQRGQHACRQEPKCASGEVVAENKLAEECCPHRVERNEEHRAGRVSLEEGEGESQLVANLDQRRKGEGQRVCPHAVQQRTRAASKVERRPQVEQPDEVHLEESSLPGRGALDAGPTKEHGIGRHARDSHRRYQHTLGPIAFGHPCVPGLMMSCPKVMSCRARRGNDVASLLYSI